MDVEEFAHDIAYGLTFGELKRKYSCTSDDIRRFISEQETYLIRLRQKIRNAEQIESDIAESEEPVWITSPSERLQRIQTVADLLYKAIRDGLDPALLREFRAYLKAAEEERAGSGEDDTGVSIEFIGVDGEQLK